MTNKLKTLLAAATPEKWEASNNDGYSIWRVYGPAGVIADVIGGSPETDANAELIPALRNAAPALLAVVDAARNYLSCVDSGSLESEGQAEDALRATLSAYDEAVK